MAGSIVVLYRGGRLPSWHQLRPDQQVAFQDEHVDLMLTVGARHGLQSIEGFRLLAPRGEWERWWTIRFPDLAGAEAWMRAEVAPPYGRYGSYEYQRGHRRRWHGCRSAMHRSPSLTRTHGWCLPCPSIGDPSLSSPLEAGSAVRMTSNRRDVGMQSAASDFNAWHASTR